MASDRTDVPVRFGVPWALRSAVSTSRSPLVHVPDVRLRAEATAVEEIAAAGLVPGQRDPRPRPVTGRPEVVIRTHPRGGTVVREGTRIDYAVAPGEPQAPIPDHGDDVAAATTSAASALPTAPRPAATTQVAADGYVDFDVAETVHDPWSGGVVAGPDHRHAGTVERGSLPGASGGPSAVRSREDRDTSAGAALTLPSSKTPPPQYVDFDVIDTLVRLDRRPVAERA